MATLRGGKKACDACGNECTNLPGFEMRVLPNMMGDERVKAAADKIKKEFGIHDFTFCWSCTAKAFGAKSKLKGLGKQDEEKTETKAETKSPAKTKKK